MQIQEFDQDIKVGQTGMKQTAIIVHKTGTDQDTSQGMKQTRIISHKTETEQDTGQGQTSKTTDNTALFCRGAK